MNPQYAIREDDLSGPEIAELLRFHLAEMHLWSPACKVHAMPIERLREPDVTFFSAWDGERLAACGAIKQLDNARGELKSMRAAPGYRGKGAGKAIFDRLVAEASNRGYRWLGLETGRTEPFEPARRLYERNGFTECPAFGDYVADEFSICMSREL
ncbi:MAG TPA: GNAT family N-acetyltransferase [Sphingomonadaceae bacterium]|nr:GNAT family N-acetyltransferase [Sphingomonadaceae bacterium]